MKQLIILFVFCCIFSTVSMAQNNEQPPHASYTKELLSIPGLDLPTTPQSKTATATPNITPQSPNAKPTNTILAASKQKLSLRQKLSLLKKTKHAKPNTQSDINIIGIIGFSLVVIGAALSFVSIPFLGYLAVAMILGGLVCSIIGLNHPKKTFAIIGIVLAGIYILFVALFLLFIISLLNSL